MPHRHLNPKLLDRLVRGEATPDETRDLVRHLVDSCPLCARGVPHDVALENPLDLDGRERVTDGGVPASDPMEGMFTRVQSRLQPVIAVLHRLRGQTPALLEELRRHPLERQRMLVLNHQRFQTLPFAELVLETAWELGVDQPVEADSMVSVAMDILERVDSSLFGVELLNDIRGRAWAYRGNFLRIGSELREAEEAFARAERSLAEGTGDLLEWARLLGLKATLRRTQKRRDEAADLLDEALAIYLALDESHLAGRTMVTQALLHSERGEAAEALEVLREAQRRIEPERDPYLMRVVQQNLASYLLDLGRYEEAMAMLPALRTRMLESGGRRLELLRLRWLEGKILLGLGHESRAEAAFLEVRKGFVEQGIAHDAATVSLQLASLYLRQGRTAEIRELTSQLVPIFQSRDLHQNAIAALLLFQQAVERDALTLRLVEEVADVVRKFHEKPRLKTAQPS